jgi:hypothetical protein
MLRATPAVLTIPFGHLVGITAAGNLGVSLSADYDLVLGIGLAGAQAGNVFLYTGSAGSAVATTRTQGSATQSEVQVITVTATGGTFALTFGGQTAALLPYDISAANLQAALGGLSTIGSSNIAVQKSGGQYTITFQGTLANQDVAQITVDGSLLTATTHVDFSVGAQGQNLNFTAQWGSKDAFVIGGSVSETGAIQLNLNDVGRLNIFTPGGGLTLPKATAFDTTPADLLTGSATVDLPLFAGSPTAPISVSDPDETGVAGSDPLQNHLTISIASLSDVVLAGTITSVGLPTLTYFEDPSVLELLNNPAMTVDGLDRILGFLQDAIDGQLLGIKIPFIGDVLSGNPAVQFIANLRSELLGPLANTLRANTGDLQSLMAQIVDVLNSAFGTEVQGGIGGITGVTGTVSGTNEHYAQFDLMLGDTIPIASTNIKFDLGIPALNISADLHPEISLNWGLHFGFGIDDLKGFYFVADPNALFVNLTVDFGSAHGTIATASGQILFLSLDLTDEVHDFSAFGPGEETPHYSQVQLGGNIALHSDTDGPISGQKILTAADFTGASFGDIVQPSLFGNADLAMHAKVDFGALAALVGNPSLANVLPAVSADLIAHWGLSLSAGTKSFGDPFLAFEHISLDLGSFISDFAGPILHEIYQILSPLDWLIGPSGLLNMRLPLLSDLAGTTITIKDLIPVLDPTDGPGIVKFIDAIEQLDYISGLVDQATSDSSGLALDFGSLVISNPSNIDDGGIGAGSLISGGGVQSMKDFSKLKLPGTLTNNQTGGDETNAVKSFLAGVSGVGAGDSSSGKLSFPILQPANVIKLLLGQSDVTLFDYVLPPLNFNFEFEAVFPIFPPLDAFISGLIKGGLTLDVGYDATGLFDFFKSGNPLDLADGFFINALDPQTGQPTPQATFYAELAAGAEINLGVAKAGVEGGISATINFFLDDLNEDGKIRLSELADNLAANSFNPLSVFDISGEMDLFLRAFLEIDLGLFTFSTDYTFAQLTLFKFSSDFTRPAFLGSVDGAGALTLNIGPDAGNRLHGDINDDNESITVSGTSGDISVTGFGTTQHFSGVKSIIADGGQGDDTIDLSGVTDSTITELIHGDAGNDTIRAGNGTVQIFGDDGNDTLVGYNGAGPSGVQTLDGAAGDDTIDAQHAATVFMKGGTGADHLIGGTGTNKFIGGSGNDVLRAGTGPNDFMLIGSGSDVEIDNAPGSIPGAFDFTGFADNVTFWLENGKVLAGWGAQSGSNAFNASIGLGTYVDSAGNSHPLNDYAHEAFGDISSFSSILGGNGADIFNVYNAKNPTTITLDGQQGSDVYNIYAGDPGSPPPIDVTINDHSNIWDHDLINVFGTTQNDTITVTNSTIAMQSGEMVTYVPPAINTSLLQLTVFGDLGDDTINVQSTAQTVPVEVFGDNGLKSVNDGNDTIIVGGSALTGGLSGIVEHTLAGIALGPLVLFGGGGFDTVIFDASADTTGRTGSMDLLIPGQNGLTPQPPPGTPKGQGPGGFVEVGQVNGLGMSFDGGPGVVQFEGLESVDLKLGTKSDYFTINNTITGMTLVSGGDGNDTIDAAKTNTTDRSFSGVANIITVNKVGTTFHDGSAAQNEIQTFTINPPTSAANAGAFTLTFDNGSDGPRETKPITFGADAATVANALLALNTIGFNSGNPNVDVQKNGNTYSLTFQNGLAHRNFANMSARFVPLLLMGGNGSDIINLKSVTQDTFVLGDDLIALNPNATLTPGATQGKGVTFTASLAVFSATNVGGVLRVNGGVAVINAFTDSTHVVADYITAANSAAAATVGNWSLTNAGSDTINVNVETRNATLTPGASSGVNITFTASAAVFSAADVGKTLTIDGGRVLITSVAANGMSVVGDYEDPANSTAAALQGAWNLSLPTNGVNANLTVDGGEGNDSYNVNFIGGLTNSLINVFDSGATTGDVLNMFGTANNDLFLLRAAAASKGLAFAAMLNLAANTERVNYDTTIDTINLEGGLGNDQFFIDDTRAVINVAGDFADPDSVLGGDDFFQIGQLYQSQRDSSQGIADADQFSTIQTTKGWLSNGITLPMTIHGGAGKDNFVVFHNKAELTLDGDAGDDSFIVQAFALAGSQDTERARTDVSGGAGSDLIQYAVNAPVDIDGGDGFDTVIIIGTEFNDDFVVTANGVFGAGLFVNFINIESLEVDGAEGDDRFFIQGTSPSFTTSIIGGLGSDTFDVNGPTPANGVITNSLQGHSGLIDHLVTSGDGTYDGLKSVGISANVADNDEPAIVVTPSDAAMQVTEGGTYTTYQVVLTRDPGFAVSNGTSYANTVTVTAVVPTGLVFLDPTKGFAQVLDSSDHPKPTNFALSFDSTNWWKPQTVYLQAYDPAQIAQGARDVSVQHKVSVSNGINQNNGDTIIAFAAGPQGANILHSLLHTFNPVGLNIGPQGLLGAVVSIIGGTGVGQSFFIDDSLSDPTGSQITIHGTWAIVPDATSQFQILRYEQLAIPNVKVHINDAESAGLIVTQTGGSTDVRELPNGLAASNFTDTFTVALSKAPAANQTVTVNLNVVSPSGNPIQFLVGGQVVHTLTFGSGNYSTPQVVTVQALQDGVVEGPYKQTITLTTSSNVAGSGYNGDAVNNHALLKNILVNVGDADSPQVIVSETNISTDVIEGGSLAGGGPLAPFNISVPYTDSYSIVLSKAPTQDVYVDLYAAPTRTSRQGGFGSDVIDSFQSQIIFGGSNVVIDPTTGLQAIKFTSANWFMAQQVLVQAINNAVVDGGDTKVFAQQLDLVSNIQGPLFINGAPGPDHSELTSREPQLLPGETNSSRALQAPIVSAADITDQNGITTGTITIKASDALSILNEVQTLTVDATGGTFNLSFNGASLVTPLNAGATDTQVQTALNSLSTIGGVGGSVAVTRQGNQYTIIFGGNLGHSNQPLIVADGSQLTFTPATAAATTVINGSAAHDEQQEVVVDAISGTFTLSFNGQTTAPIPYNAPAVGAATLTVVHAGVLNTTSQEDNLVVAGIDGTFKLTFAGHTTGNLAVGISAAALRTAIENLIGIGVGNVTVDPNPDGSYSIKFNNTLGPVAGSSDAGTLTGLQDKLAALSTIGAGHVTVTAIQTPLGDGVVTTYTITFTGGGLQKTDVGQITVNTSGLTGRGSAFVLTQIDGITATPENLANQLIDLSVQVTDGVGKNKVRFITGVLNQVLSGGDNLITLALNKPWEIVSTDPDQNVASLFTNIEIPTQAAVSISLAQAGGGGQSEIQIVTVDASAPSAGLNGTYVLKLGAGGATSVPIAYNATADQVRDAIVGLNPAAFTGKVTVIETEKTPVNKTPRGDIQIYTVIFDKTLGNSVALLKAPVPDVSTYQDGGVGAAALVTVQSGVLSITPQIDTLAIYANSGSFTLGLGASSTGPLAYDISAAGLQTAIAGLAGIGAGNVNVTSTAGGTYKIVFASSLNPSVLSTLLANGGALIRDDIQVLTVQAGTGSYTLSDGTNTTGLIASDASATTVQQALQSLLTLPDKVRVVMTAKGLPGSVQNVYTITYLSGTDKPQLVANVAALYDAGKFTLTTTNPNLLVDENTQTDNLYIYDGDNPSNASGVLTASAITGLGMPATQTIGGVTEPGGISYGNLEEIYLNLGAGNNNFTIQGTGAGTAVTLNAGNGNDIINVISLEGHTYINGQAGNDTITVRNPASAIVVPSGRTTQEVFVDATGGTFTLSFNGSPATGALAYNISATDLQTALNALPAIGGAGGVSVAKFGNDYRITFLGLLGTTQQPLLVANSSLLLVEPPSVTPATVTQGDATHNEVQTVSPNGASGGAYTLTFNGQTTAPISYNANATGDPNSVQVLLSKLSNIGIGNVMVTGNAGGPYTITFQGTLANTNVAQLTADASGLMGVGLPVHTLQSLQGLLTVSGDVPQANVVALAHGSPAGVVISAVSGTTQQIDVDATGGHFALTFGGQTTVALDVGISAADLQTKLNALSSIGTNGGVSVTKLPGNHYLVKFQGALANAIQPLFKADISGLTGIIVQAVNTVQQLTVDATSGTFGLSGNGSTVNGIAWNAPGIGVGSVQAALDTLYGPGNTKVIKSGNVYLITFVGTLAGADQPLLQTHDLGLSNGLGSADQLSIDDSAYLLPEVGVLTSTTLTGLSNVQPNEIQEIHIDATGGTFTLSFKGGAPTAALAWNISAADLQTALQALPSIGPGNVAVTRNDDVYVIRFQGLLTDANLPQIAVNSTSLQKVSETADGTPVTASDALDALNVGQSALIKINTRTNGEAAIPINAVQTVTVSPTGNAAGATFTLSLPGFGVPATVRYDSSAEEVRAALQFALEGNISKTDLEVAKYGNVYVIAFQGQLRDVNNGNPIPLLKVATTGAISAAITTRMDGFNYYGFEALNLQLGSNAGGDMLNVQGTGQNWVGVVAPGTTVPSVTNVTFGAGDNKVFISSNADLDNFTNTGFDFLTGDLNQLFGSINIDFGAGRHRLMVSDEAATIGDTNVQITDHASGTPALAQGLTSTAEIFITGLAQGGISYKTGASGNFFDGVQYWTGYGNDTVTIDGTEAYQTATERTTTMLNTGLGNDNITVTLSPTTSGGQKADGFFVLNTMGGAFAPVPGATSWSANGYTDDDTVNASASTLPLTIFGDAGYDNIIGGQAVDVIIGDFGRVQTVDPTVLNSTVPIATYGYGGRGDLINSRIIPAQYIYSTVAGPDFLPAHPGAPAVGGNDIIQGIGGDDILVGGAGNDMIDGGTGDDLIFGDNVKLKNLFTWVAGSPVFNIANPRFQTLAGTTIYSDTAFTDAVNVADGIIGRSFRTQSGYVPVWASWNVSYLDQWNGIDSSRAGNDYIAGGAADDVIFGQGGSDVIQGDGSILSALTANTFSGGAPVQVSIGTTTVTAQAGTAPVYAYREAASLLQVAPGQFVTALGTLHVAASVEAVSDGNDYVEGGGGNNTIFGGLGQDDLIGGNSDLFSLTTSAQRPTGSSIIFGGSGQEIARNNDVGDTALGALALLGTVAGDLHAHDADTIVADNGDIFDLVGINHTDRASGQGFLTFNYDSGQNGLVFVPGTLPPAGQTYTNFWGGTQFIIPRAVKLIDYTIGGLDFNPASAVSDIGGAAEIHGESGDDLIYGGPGNDKLFGDAQNDQIVGGWGNDWIDGGTGDDGILGDDGRILVSRNSSAYGESLYGIAAIPAAQLNLVISTPGNLQQATINVTNQLKYTAELTPLDLDPAGRLSGVLAQNISFRPQHADDIIYGGWGADFMHGGSGDDAISGAEALVTFWNNPVSDPLNVLGYQAGLQTFSAYDEFNPLQVIGGLDGSGKPSGFFLNFDATEGPNASDFATTGYKTDGNDVIFGDYGNDWLVGGTGQDHMYGGFGDDLLNADDKLTTDGGKNDATDTGVSYQDIAYGGGGRDTLIGNTGGDRLIDWVGEFNAYIVPFAPFGAAAVSRTVQPQIYQYLYDLSAGDGVDNTFSDGAGVDATRNGEPFGELGLVTQVDSYPVANWQAQTGAPNQPQAGNLPGGPRDVLRSAAFTNGQMNGVLPVSGTWTVSNNAMTATPSAVGASSFAVFDVNSYLPNYFEVTASVTAGKPNGGYNSNGYLIFDYLSPTDFKFAGVDASTNKVEIGHRTATGWVIDKWITAQITPNTVYSLFAAINGTTVTVVVNNQWSISQAYAAHVIQGVSIGLNYGIVGFGANNSISSFNNLVVQVPSPATTYTYSQSFNGSTPLYFDPATSGTWTTDSGTYTGMTTSGAAAISLLDLGLGLGMAPSTFSLKPTSLLDLKATVQTSSRAGLIYDYYSNTGSFKFAALLKDTQQIVLGHYTSKGGWVFDEVKSFTVVSGTNYTLELTGRGSTVSLTVNGALALGHVYNAVVTDGKFGLLSVNGPSVFSLAYVRTDDPAFAATIGHPQLAAAAPVGAALGDASLTIDELAPIVSEAIDRLAVTLSLSVETINELRATTITIGDLPGLELGYTFGDTVTISRSAAGFGWFVDPTPDNDVEFRQTTTNGLVATPASRAYGEMDLLSVVTHELGHVLGLDESNTGFMSELLVAGTRLAPSVSPNVPHVFDEASGNFVSVKEMVQLRALRNDLINLPMNGQLPGWIIRDVADNGVTHQSAGLRPETAPRLPEDTTSGWTSSRPHGLTGTAEHPVKAGKFIGGLISWNKGLVGSSLSRLHSLL